MLLLWGSVVGLIAGHLAHGSLRALGDLPLRGVGWIFAVLLLQVILFASPLAEVGFVVAVGPLAFVVSLLVLAWQLGRNRALGRGVDIALVGLCLNLLVIALNGGRMPARVDLLVQVRGEEKAHAVTSTERSAYATAAHDASRLVWLGDQIPVQLPGYHGNVYSIGDVFISAGLGFTLFTGMQPRGWRPARRRTARVSTGDAPDLSDAPRVAEQAPASGEVPAR